MALARTSTGAFNNGLAGFTASFGAGATAGDLGLLLTETANQACPDPSGWTTLGWAPVGSAGVAGGTRATVQYRTSITSGEVSGGIAVGDSGDHQLAALLSYSGADATTPLITSSATVASVTTTSVASSVTFAASNAKAGDILLAIIATDRDSNTTSTNAGASWSGVTGTNNGFILNGSTFTGAGGGLIVHELAVTSDATANIGFSCTITSSIWAMVMVVVKAPVASRTATLAKTLGAVTSSSNANLKISGTLAKTLATVTLSDTAKLLIQGSLAKTLAPVTLAAANGHVATLSNTLGTLTLSSAAKLKIVGTLGKTLGAVTSSSNGQLLLKASLAKTLGVLTLGSNAKLLIQASLAKTLGTLTASGVSKLLIKGTDADTLGTLTLSSSSKLLIKASLAKTLGVLTLSSQGSFQSSGSLAQSLEALTSTSSGRLLIKASASVSLSLSLSSTGEHSSATNGSLGRTLSLLRLSSTTHTISPKTVRYITPFKSSVLDQINRSRTHRSQVNTQRIRT